MKKFSGIIILILLVTVNIKAQKTHTLTVQQAVAIALQQSYELKNARIDVKNQQSVNDEITGRAHPQVTGNLGVTRLFSIPVTVLPDFISPSVYGVLKDNDVRNGSGQPVVQPAGPPSTFPARFGVPWQASAGISMQQLLFQPDVFVGLIARKAALKLYDDQIRIKEDTLRSAVMRSYYGVLVGQKRLQFLNESIARLEKLQKDQGELFKNGFIEKLDLDKTQVSLNNVKTLQTQLNNFIQLGYAALKFTCTLPQTDSLVLTDSLTNDELKKDILTDATGFKYEDRSEVKLLNTSNELLNLDLKRYKLGSLPTVAAQWNVSTAAQRQKFNFFNGDKWFFSNILGFNISVPIYNGGQRKQKMIQAQYAIDKNNNTIDQFKQVVDLQLSANKIGLTNALLTLDNQKENLALAEKVYNITKKKYEQGLGSSFEVLQAETAIQEANGNYYQALYDAVIARLGYKRALGKL